MNPSDFDSINLSRKFELRHHFLPFNYTVCFHHENEWIYIRQQRHADR